VKTAQKKEGGWGKAYLRDIPEAEDYRNAWSLVQALLVGK